MIDDLVANDVLDVMNPSVPTNFKEPVAGPSKPFEDDAMVGWDSDSTQCDSEEDLDSHPDS